MQKRILSTINGSFLESDQFAFVLGDPVRLQVPEATGTKSAVVVVPHGGASVVRHKVVFLVVSSPEQLEHSGVSVVADCTKNHVIAFLKGTESNILHGLHEGECAAICLSSFVLQVGVKGILVIQVVTSPKIHGGDPGK